VLVPVPATVSPELPDDSDVVVTGGTAAVDDCDVSFPSESIPPSVAASRFGEKHAGHRSTAAKTLPERNR
jgi:hypothetical protein